VRVSVIEQDPRWSDYQHNEARRLLAELKKHRRVLFVLPTAGGKTVIASWIMRQWLLAGKRVLVLVHRRELLEQMYETLTSGADVDEDMVGVIWRDDHRTNADAPIQVASIDTAIRRKKFPAADYVICDEAHHSVAAKWQRVISWYPEANILGLTATPERLDGKPLGIAFDVMVEGPTVQKLIDMGHLMKPRVFAREQGRSIDLTNIRRSMGDYAQGEVEKRSSKPNVIKGVVDHIKKHAQGRSGIVFACGVKHCNKLAAAFKAAGLKCEIVLGNTGIVRRRQLLEPGGWLDSGQKRYVITCDVLSEGYDLPSAKRQCQCGSQKVIPATYVVNGNTKSCGCARLENFRRGAQLSKDRAHRYALFGEALSISELVILSGKTKTTVTQRLAAGYSAADAILLSEYEARSRANIARKISPARSIVRVDHQQPRLAPGAAYVLGRPAKGARQVIDRQLPGGDGADDGPVGGLARIGTARRGDAVEVHDAKGNDNQACGQARASANAR
jgi:hypothetical protein